MFQMPLIDQADQFSRPEHLFEMQRLALVDDIEHPLRRRMHMHHPVLDRRKVRRVIAGAAARIEQHHRWHFLLVALTRHMHDQGALALLGKARLAEPLDQAGDQVVDIALALPQVERDIEKGIIHLQRRHRHVDEMLQQRPIAGPPRLQLGHGSLRALVARWVVLGLVAGRRIQSPEILDRHRRRVGIRPGIALVEIDQVRLLVMQLGDKVAHLQAPVAKVRIRNHRIAEKFQEPLQRVADHRRAQMPDMHRLGHVRPAEIDHGHVRVGRQLATRHVLVCENVRRAC